MNLQNLQPENKYDLLELILLLMVAEANFGF